MKKLIKSKLYACEETVKVCVACEFMVFFTVVFNLYFILLVYIIVVVVILLENGKDLSKGFQLIIIIIVLSLSISLI